MPPMNCTGMWPGDSKAWSSDSKVKDVDEQRVDVVVTEYVHIQPNIFWISRPAGRISSIGQRSRLHLLHLLKGFPRSTSLAKFRHHPKHERVEPQIRISLWWWRNSAKHWYPRLRRSTVLPGTTWRQTQCMSPLTIRRLPPLTSLGSYRMKCTILKKDVCTHDSIDLPRLLPDLQGCTKVWRKFYSQCCGNYWSSLCPLCKLRRGPLPMQVLYGDCAVPLPQAHHCITCLLLPHSFPTVQPRPSL